MWFCYATTKYIFFPRKYRCVSGTDLGLFLRGFDLIKLLFLLYVFGKTDVSKQCRPWSDAAECGVWSGSTLFATHPAILHIFIVSKNGHWGKGKEIRGQTVFKFVSCIQNFPWKWIFEKGVGWGWGGGGAGFDWAPLTLLNPPLVFNKWSSLNRKPPYDVQPT